MYSASVQQYVQWREVARPLLTAGIVPEDMEWRVGPRFEPLAWTDPATAIANTAPLRLSRRLVELLETISCFRHDGRWDLMYRLAWRWLRHPHLLEDAADPDVHRAMQMENAVNREVHKMHAFVRFREMTDEQGEKKYFAWFEPTHEVLRLGAPFFCKRFPNMEWMIATPDGTALWQDGALQFIETPDKSSLPKADAHEGLWRTYYRNICNVSRINPPAMRREMPQRYWRNLPESIEIQNLLRDGQASFEQRQREAIDVELTKARAMQRALADLPDYSGGPAACRRCDIWRHATQAVLGEGSNSAAIMLVGEQPGDEEDLRGRPFVGPAGRVLDAALRDAGLERKELYITNAVKHFKWQPRGKRRLHKRPEAAEIAACNHWLEAEVSQVKPRIIVALGASALRAIGGLTDSIDSARQLQISHASGAHIVCTYHPSAILRADAANADTLRTHLVDDLRRARELAA
ncbi:UdgX family uracil-DNA binding protein [Steroidobacter sp. S1-65]|uniref:Type-4 uracil-DNA glycosylase n=1 Tax=Steroidobacter gossypii TaxID=2805490 RepID=A0ABS1X4H0_9GAMM|nr:UdgX family uracil-DNA binding protein [Steroidobacter gossypii]MBM0108119.1 UdgX family uracil-DNA binding protein [Steroidobacter gossypii]